MAATLTLDWHELLWYLEGAARGSHLRWGIYEDFVNKVFPQLNEKERECIYAYTKRDLLPMKEKYNDADLNLIRQMLARFDPSNQYEVVLKNGKEKETIQAYLWEGEYRTIWSRCCNPDFIKLVKHLPYSKCRNTLCQAKDGCKRFTEYKEGDKTLVEPEVFHCTKCDFKIDKDNDEEQQPIDVPLDMITNPVQSLQLLTSGMPRQTADKRAVPCNPSNLEMSEEDFLVIKADVQYFDSMANRSFGAAFVAWTMQRLIEILPQRIDMQLEYPLERSIYRHDNSYVVAYKSHVQQIEFRKPSLAEALVGILCYLLRKDFTKGQLNLIEK